MGATIFVESVITELGILSEFRPKGGCASVRGIWNTPYFWNHTVALYVVSQGLGDGGGPLQRELSSRVSVWCPLGVAIGATHGLHHWRRHWRGPWGKRTSTGNTSPPISTACFQPLCCPLLPYWTPPVHLQHNQRLFLPHSQRETITRHNGICNIHNCKMLHL